MKLEDIKEFLKDKRKRAILILLIYFIFFIFVYYIFHTYKTIDQPQEEVVLKTPLETYCEMGNYEFDATYEVNNQILEISGKNFRQDVYLTINQEDYYLKDNIFYKIEDDKLILTNLDIKFYSVDDICSSVNKAVLVSKSEDYENDYIINKYNVPIKDIDIDTNFYLSLIEEDEKIIGVEIDLSNYRIELDEDISKYVIKINYKNIGEVKNFTSIYDKEKIVEEKEVEE